MKRLGAACPTERWIDGQRDEMVGRQGQGVEGGICTIDLDRSKEGTMPP